MFFQALAYKKGAITAPREKLCWIVKLVVVKITRLEHIAPFVHGGFGGEQIVITIVAAAFACCAGNFVVPAQNEVGHADKQRDVMLNLVTTIHYGVAARAASHRSEVDDIETLRSVVAKINRAEMLNGMQGGGRQGLFKLAVWRDKPEVKRRYHSKTKVVETRNVQSGAQPGVVDFEACNRVLIQHENHSPIVKKFIVARTTAVYYTINFYSCQFFGWRVD